MTQRHKHADVIIAWANGAEIEWRETPDKDWESIKCPGFFARCEYRVKPPAKKYRVALFQNGNNGDYYTSTADMQEDAAYYENCPVFVRWLTDWIEYEE